MVVKIKGAIPRLTMVGNEDMNVIRRHNNKIHNPNSHQQISPSTSSIDDKPSKSLFQSIDLNRAFSDSSHDKPKSGERRNSYTYQSPGTNENEDGNGEVPLSMRFIHKPSRSQEAFERANDPTKQNSLLNSQLSTSTTETETSASGETSPRSSQSPFESPTPDPCKLVRKKSGEILKSSLRERSYFDKKRAQSEPSTPSFKTVHFGGDTDVKYFKKKDRPNAISATNSPNLDDSDHLMSHMNIDDWSDSDSDEGSAVTDENYDYLDDELNTRSDESLDEPKTTKYPNPKHGKLINWELGLPNFPNTNYISKIQSLQLPVFLERVFITVDKKYLLGQIAVKNLSFEKNVVVRYTADGWNSIIEIPTIYVPDIPSILKLNNYDRFVFKIPLDNIFNTYKLNNNTKKQNEKYQENSYDLCIRYSSNNQDFWDNNNGSNYNIRLTKKIVIKKDDFKPPFNLSTPNQIQDHNKKPKYSSSYLKKRNSDSSIPDDHMFHNDNGSSDFIRNNFYLSSPLLSSLDTKDVDHDLGLDHPKRPPLKSNLSQQFPQTPPKPQPPQNQDTQSHFKRNFLDTKSYKELLESYCFFSTPRNIESPNSSYVNGAPDDGFFNYNDSQRTTDGSNVSTVSSFLKD